MQLQQKIIPYSEFRAMPTIFKHSVSMFKINELPDKSGIYAVMSKDKFLFIEGSWSIKLRMMRHPRLQEFLNNAADSVCYLVLDEKLIPAAELEAINEYKPTLNSQVKLLSTKLRDKTYELFFERLELANQSKLKTVEEIARETGLKKSWLRGIANGQIDDPSCCKIETLYEYLTQTKLKV